MTIKGQPGEQLKMLMSANEIKAAGYQPSEGPMDRKYYRGNRIRYQETEPLHAAIEREGGVREPIPLGEDKRGKILTGGHHRVAYMEQKRPDDLMPVIHIAGGFSKTVDDMARYYGGYK